MFWVMYSEKSKGLTDLGLLVCIQSVLFSKLRTALGRWTGFRSGDAVLRWLQNRQ